MSATKLIHALRNLADEIYSLRDSHPGDAKNLDHAGLACQVLAHVVNGKTIEKAFGAPGDWGYNNAIGQGILAMLREPREGTSCPFCGELDWHYVQDEMPDDDTRVMLAFDDKTDEPSFGFRRDGAWYYDNLDDPDAVLDPRRAMLTVYAWAHVPAVPAKKGGGS